MRWLILTDDYPPAPGGVATWTEAVARGLVAAGDAVTVLARARPGLATPGVDVIPVRWPSFGRWGAAGLAVAALRHRYDAVLATTWNVAKVLSPWLAARGVPLHIVAHGSDVTRGLGPAFDRVAGRARCWAVSKFLAEHIRARGFACDVLPAPIDARGEPRGRVSTAPSRWMFAGRATPLKGGDRFVRWIAAAGVEGWIFGDGPELPRWRELAATTGARVRFFGAVDRDAVRAAFDDVDLAVLVPRPDHDGSGAEGLGLALIEAANAGIPVVGCRTGGVPEAAGPGLIVDDPDDAAACAAAVSAWWNPQRGAESAQWVRSEHGIERLIEHLRGVPLARGAPAR